MHRVGRIVFVFGLALIQGSGAWGQAGVKPSDTLNYRLLPFELPGLDLNFSGAGAAPRGMSGAFTGMSGNLAAISFNPAGLAALDRPQTALVYRYNRPTVRNRQYDAGLGSVPFDNNIAEGFNQIDFGALAAPGKLFGRTFVGAVSYTVYADQFFADQVKSRAPVLVDTVHQITNYNFARKTEGKLTGFNLGAATRIGPVSLGTTFLIYQGGFGDTTDLKIGPFYLKPKNGQDTAYSLPALDHQRLANKVSYRGTSLIFGAQAEFNRARVGLSVRFPAFSSGKTDFFRLKSNMDIGFYDSVFESGLYRGELSQDDRLFLTDSYLELPLSVSTGLAYRVGRSFLFDADYVYTNWGAADLKVRRIFEAPFSNKATLVLGSAPVSLTSTHQVRLGWEAELHPNFGQVLLRGGVRNLPFRSLTSLLPVGYDTTYQDSFVTDAQGNVIDTISTVALKYAPGVEENPAADWNNFGASLGVGVRWNQVALDVAYDFTTYRQASRSVSPVSGPLVTYRRLRQHRLFFGFTGYFTRI